MALLLSFSLSIILSGDGGTGADLVRPMTGGGRDEDDDNATVSNGEL